MGGVPEEGSGERKTDLRVVKTREAIQAAFERLMETTAYPEITVSAVAREARVSRKTFYAHYACVDDLLGLVAQRAVDEIAREIQPDGELVDMDEWVSEFVRITLEKLRESSRGNDNVARLMADGSFVEVFRGPLELLCRRELAKRGLAFSKGHEYVLSFFIGGLCATYETWASLSRDPSDLDEAARLIACSSTQGVAGLLVPA